MRFDYLLVLQIHWFSIFNSFMMVIFLTGLVSMILMRTLRNDYAKYAREDDDLETLVIVLSLFLKWVILSLKRTLAPLPFVYGVCVFLCISLTLQLKFMDFSGSLQNSLRLF